MRYMKNWVRRRQMSTFFIAGAGSLFMKPTLVGESPLDEYV